MTEEGVSVPEEQKADGMELLSTMFDEVGDLFGFEGDQDFQSILGGTFNFGMMGEMMGSLMEMMGPMMENIMNSFSAITEPLMEATNVTPEVAPSPEVTPAPEVTAQNNVTPQTPSIS